MNNDRIRVANWPHPTAPTETDMQSQLEKEGLSNHCWSRDAGHVSKLHTHTFDKVVYVVRGRVTYRLPESNRTVQLGAGDRLDLPAYVLHNTMAGPDGVYCIEGRRHTSA